MTDITLDNGTLAAPGKLICIGLNYRDHALEAGFDLPTQPLSFAKFPSSLIGPGEPIRIPTISKDIDYEAELAVIIGRAARDVTPDEALDYVIGYTCFNDVSARDIQAADGQWTRSKSLDTFGPIGPRIASADEIDPQALAIRCLLNGEVMQEGSTADMVFSVAEIVSYVSRDTTLEPGDIIATGTPAGIGLSKRPPRFLVDGDEFTVEIEGIGSVTNPVIG